MIIQATPYGTKKEEPFAFTYSGDFTDERVDGIGDVTLNTSGTLVTTGKTVTVSVYILAGGGGGAQSSSASSSNNASGGGGGNQTVEVELAPGMYEIVIGTGGTGLYSTNIGINSKAGTGGDTTAFGYTSTGGIGAGRSYSMSAGTGGTPNGGDGSTGRTSGGSPNGGASNGGSADANSGGDGYVRITFS